MDERRSLPRKRGTRRDSARRDAELYRLESLLWKVGLRRVAGTDEVGVGPLAGAVVAAAVIFPPGVVVSELADSKQLSAGVRERLAAEIRQRAVVGIGAAEVDEIDRLNIYQARLMAIRRAVESLPEVPEFVLVDGREVPGLPHPQSAYVRGDSFVASIAAASIIAKVHRDEYMRELDGRFPGYGFGHNMGYGTREHIEALQRYGPSPVHRRSFRPVAMPTQDSLFAAGVGSDSRIR
jgi:ribonuclease HII